MEILFYYFGIYIDFLNTQSLLYNKLSTNFAYLVSQITKSILIF